MGLLLALLTVLTPPTSLLARIQVAITQDLQIAGIAVVVMAQVAVVVTLLVAVVIVIAVVVEVGIITLRLRAQPAVVELDLPLECLNIAHLIMLNISKDMYVHVHALSATSKV